MTDNLQTRWKNKFGEFTLLPYDTQNIYTGFIFLSIGSMAIPCIIKNNQCMRAPLIRPIYKEMKLSTKYLLTEKNKNRDTGFLLAHIASNCFIGIYWDIVAHTAWKIMHRDTIKFTSI